MALDIWLAYSLYRGDIVFLLDGNLNTLIQEYYTCQAEALNTGIVFLRSYDCASRKIPL
jgi:hypothetical protein